MHSESPTLASVIAFPPLPAVCGRPAGTSASGVTCPSCDARFPMNGGILDMMGDEQAEVITPFQRVMQTALVVAVYERIWRRIGYFIASSRSFGRED